MFERVAYGVIGALPPAYGLPRGLSCEMKQGCVSC
jgi:hypothetical protein